MELLSSFFVVILQSGLSQIRSLDEHAGVMVCEAGCILEKLEEKANSVGLMVPLDLGPKGRFSQNLWQITLFALIIAKMHAAVSSVEMCQLWQEGCAYIDMEISETVFLALKW
jgi:hypothetical protein